MCASVSHPEQPPSRIPVNADQLRLPFCPLPRPGDAVRWYQQAQIVRGTMLGHTPDGRPVVANQFGGAGTLESFELLRLEDPSRSIGPNWNRLPSSGSVLQPTARELSTFKSLLEQRIPPGPRYTELVHEIWSRGYEVFVVGGTVRDVIANHATKDVDLVTSMPLTRVAPLLRAMYGLPAKLERGALVNGHFRLGGAPRSGDPFIDLCVFKHSLCGTDNAIFGADFERDVGHRDFACNAIYYDPVNETLIDPSGVGVSDAESCSLGLVFDNELRAPRHEGQLVIRFMKFLSRGYQPSGSCGERIIALLPTALAAMHSGARVAYIRAQVLSKVPVGDRAAALENLRLAFDRYNAVEVWNNLVLPFQSDLLA